jgi:hypothetical protein
MDDRIEKMEKQISTLKEWLVLCVICIVVLFAGLIFTYNQSRSNLKLISEIYSVEDENGVAHQIGVMESY